MESVFFSLILSNEVFFNVVLINNEFFTDTRNYLLSINVLIFELEFEFELRASC